MQAVQGQGSDRLGSRAQLAGMGLGCASNVRYASAVETPASGFTSATAAFEGTSERTNTSPVPS